MLATTKRSVKKTVKKTMKTSKKSNVKPTGFKVKYDGLSSKIFSKPVRDLKKLPTGVHATIAAAKKDIVKRIKADTAKAITRVNGLKTAKSEPKSTK